MSTTGQIHVRSVRDDPTKGDGRPDEQELEAAVAWQHMQEVVADHGRVTLLFGASDREHNQAVVLQALLTR